METMHYIKVAAVVLREIDNLSTKEREIFKMRHGLEDGNYHSLEEVGKKFGVTRERIRQIETTMIMKLGAAAQQFLEGITL